MERGGWLRKERLRESETERERKKEGCKNKWASIRNGANKLECSGLIPSQIANARAIEEKLGGIAKVGPLALGSGSIAWILSFEI